MTLWDQSIDWLTSWRLEEETLGNMILFMVAEQKPLGRKKDDQVSEESPAPEFILYIQE